MHRILIFLAGTVVGYIVSGYIEGLTEEEHEEKDGNRKQAAEVA